MASEPFEPGSFRQVPSAVGAVKRAYRDASPRQRQQLRAWFRDVLSGVDGNDGADRPLRAGDLRPRA